MATAKKLFENHEFVGDREKASKLLSSIPLAAREYKDAQALLKKVDAKIKEEAALKAELGEAPENSAWDGSVRCVKKYLEKVLRDPDSVSYEEWSAVSRTTYDGKRYYMVIVNYRAKNGFGGMNLTQSTFLMRHNQVVKML